MALIPRPVCKSRGRFGFEAGGGVVSESCDQGCSVFGFVSVPQIAGPWQPRGGHLLLGHLDAATHWPYLNWAQVCLSTACPELELFFTLARKPRQNGNPKRPMGFEIGGC